MKSLLILLSFVSFSTAAIAQEAPDPLRDGHINYPREYPTSSHALDRPSLKDLSNLETKFWQARESGNVDFLGQLVSDNAMIASSTGAMNKQELVAQVESGACKIRSYHLQDFVLKPSTPTAFVISYRATQDAVCNGKPLLHDLNISASFIKRPGKRFNGRWWPGEWQSISHEETPATSH